MKDIVNKIFSEMMLDMIDDTEKHIEIIKVHLKELEERIKNS